LKFNNPNDLTVWAQASGLLWLFLDYDGTLAEFAPTPDHIEPDPTLIHLIEHLARKEGIRVSILSGRRLAHLRRLLPVKGVILAGTYGIELLDENGQMIQRLRYEELRPVLEAIKPDWEGLIQGRDGFYLEDKGWALALHARFAEAIQAEQVIAQAMQVLKDRAPSQKFRVLGGHKFLELAPRLASKREAVAYLLERYGTDDARLLYIGDDDKDEEAFPIIHAHGGKAVKVFQPSQTAAPTTADFFLDSPSRTRAWLQGLL
jgi:trehalose 6-phosphate phosphatase